MISKCGHEGTISLIKTKESSSKQALKGSVSFWRIVNPRKKSSIFEGVCAYIDGSTETSYLVLRQMICNHGGSFVPAMYGAKITHYIAENVSLAKKKSLYTLHPNFDT